MKIALIAFLADVIIGTVFVTLVANYRPGRLTNYDRTFRYDVACYTIFLWPIAFLLFIFWSLTWPARKAVTSKSGILVRRT